MISAEELERKRKLEEEAERKKKFEEDQEMIIIIFLFICYFFSNANPFLYCSIDYLLHSRHVLSTKIKHMRLDHSFSQNSKIKDPFMDSDSKDPVRNSYDFQLWVN